MASSRESKQFLNISATTAAFTLRGGRYGIDITASWGGGSVTLQHLAADGSTWITVVPAFTIENYSVADLQVGDYRFLVVTSTAIYIDLQSIAVPV